MTELLQAIGAERLKLKRTLALWMTFIAPLTVVAYIVMMFLLGGEEALPTYQDSTWNKFLQSVTIFWALLMLPLFVTLQTALLGGMEHRSKQWKHLYALPLPRWVMYLAKQVVAAGLMALSHAALAVFTVAGGCLLWLLLPGLGFHTGIPWGAILRRSLICYLSSWLILAIHTWVGLRWRNFVVAMAAGIVLTVSGMVIINSEWGSFYPWALAGQIINGFGKGEPLPVAEFLFGWLGGVALVPLACWRLGRREVG